MDTVDVKLLDYHFRFRRLSWREEMKLKYPPKQHPFRIVLAASLEEISGLQISCEGEATRVLNAIPSAIIERIYKVYRGTLPPTRRFKTGGLYAAPAPAKFHARVQEANQEQELEADQASARVAAHFSAKELQEAKEISDQITRASGLRGAVRVKDE